MYFCQRCGYSTNIKGNLRNHYKRKTPCKSILNNIDFMYLKQNINKLIENKCKSNVSQLINCKSNVSRNEINCKSNVSQNKIKCKSNVSQLINCKSNVSQNVIKCKLNISKNEIKCKAEKLKIFKCKYCNKCFKHRQSKYNHEKYKRCKINSINITKLTEEIELLKERNKNLINRLEQNIQMTNTTNIENQQINIHINNYGNENLDYITKDFITRILKGPYVAVQKLIKHIHFNPQHPENSNIKITNKKLPFASVYKNNKWEVRNKKEVIEDIVDKSYNILDSEFFETNNKKLSNTQKQRYIKFQKKYDTKEKSLKKKLNKDIEIQILNYCV